MDGTDAWLRFLVGALATWRLAHLLAHEDGPADVIVSLRVWAGQRAVGHLMDCFNCLSVWVAAPIAFFIADGALNVVLVWLALSGAACLLQRLGHQPLQIHAVAGLATPDIGGDDALLRSQESQADDDRHAE